MRHLMSFLKTGEVDIHDFISEEHIRAIRSWLSEKKDYFICIYIWSQKTGLKTGDDPASLDELDSKWYLNYIEPGKMGSFADVMTGRRVDAQWVVDDVFWETDVLMVAIFDAKRLDESWGVGKMSDYVIQKYWLKKDDVPSLQMKE